MNPDITPPPQVALAGGYALRVFAAELHPQGWEVSHA
jgi:hypothetical protein